MRTAVVEIEAAGPLTTIQDEGRRGLMRYGVPASGPMDRTAYGIAQGALGNGPGAGAIEASLGGLMLRCLEGPIAAATAGGGFHVVIDGETVPSWGVAIVPPGARLAIRAGPWGTWTYLAFAGRIVAPSWLGSRATHLRAGLGGGALAAGQRLEIAVPDGPMPEPGPLALPVTARARRDIRVVLGPQDRFFAPEAVDAFLAGPYALTSSYDRMGVRLRGPALPVQGRLDMPSEAVVRGAVQVAGDGQPTVLLADHQTTGGYPKVATIASIDIDAFAQLRPNALVRFRAVSPEQAVALLRTRRRFMGAESPIPPA
ncbi:MAG TPA: biotin-dependent carboxyltransferase family protein [Microvirga sp.]|jgi:allophanate hydrolase|nr:biotin-dependent carboxyltransferase family protein [Microvirga sp.]